VPAAPAPESAELTLLATVLVPDAPEATEATVLAPEATELAVEPVVEAPSESEDETLDIWNYAGMLMRSVYDGLRENRGGTEGAGDAEGKRVVEWCGLWIVMGG
jgi:hypothetical protein